MKKPTPGKQMGERKTATAPSPTDANAAAAATSPTDAGVVATSTSIPQDVTARGLHSECVVCQDAEVTYSLILLSFYLTLAILLQW